MAIRRMFSKNVINSAKFLRMPQTSRLLYYDLGMAADDDGIVEAFTVIRTTGAAEDDLRVLAAKGFIVILNDDMVSYISAWNENNQIRKDRYTPSIYAGLMVKLVDGNQIATVGLPDGNQMETQVSIGKDSTDKDRIGDRADKPPTRHRFSPPGVEEVKAYCQEQGYTSVDPERFVNFYESKGWVVGKSKMKSWQAAVRNWAKRESEEKGNGKCTEDYTEFVQNLGLRL